jgi:cold-inducible RNA-binding protein
MVSGAFYVYLEVNVATKLFVGNLPFTTTSDDLEGMFADIGAVSSANVIADKLTGRSRGFGFVEMEHAEDAERAITQLNGREINGRALTVNEAKPRESRGDFGGRSSFGGGKPRGGGRGADRGQRW